MKSIYLKNFTATAVLISLGLLLVAVSALGLGRGYVINEYMDNMLNCAFEVAHTASAVAEEESLNSWRLGMILSSVSKAAGNHIFITDENDRVVCCCDDFPFCIHYYKVIPENLSRVSSSSDVYQGRQMLEGYKFFFRAENTRLLYLRRYVTDPDYVTPEYRMEYEQGPIAKVYRSMVPEGHIFMPARPYPPVRTPDWQNGVPYPPEPFCRWKNLPPEDFIYDAEHDEFVLPEGYVSDDGLIDDKSVIWHPETCEVDIGYVGGERTVWNYKKFLDPRGVWEPGSWAAEYQIRLYQQCEEDKAQNRLLQHAPYEDEIPPYDRIPLQNKK